MGAWDIIATFTAIDGISNVAKGIGGAVSGMGQSAGGAASGISGLLGGIAGGIADVAAGAIAAAADMGASVISAASEHQDAMVMLDNATKNYTKSQVGAKESSADFETSLVGLADKYSLLTKYSNDTIIDSESLMERYQNIGENIFPQAEQAAMDYAAATGGDLSSATQTLGKALDNPIKGMSELNRQGIMFTAAEKNRIIVMQQSGDMAGAQSIILSKLKDAYGGAAEAAGSTFSGQLAILGNTFQQVMQTIGGIVLPVLTSALSGINQFVQGGLAQFQNFVNSIKGLSIGDVINKIFTGLKTSARDILGQLGFSDGAISTIIGGINSAQKAISGAVQGVISAVSDIWSKLNPAQQFQEQTKDLGGHMVTTMQAIPATPLIDNLKSMITTAVSWLQQNGPTLIGNALNGLISFGADAFSNITTSLSAVFTKAIAWLQSGQLASDISTAIQSIFQPGDGTSFLSSVKGLFNRVFDWIKTSAAPAVGTLLVEAFMLTGSLLQQIGQGLEDAWNSLFQPGGAGDTALQSIGLAWHKIWDKGGVLDSVWKTVGDWISAGISGAVAGIAGWIETPFVDAIHTVGQLLQSMRGIPLIGAQLGTAGDELMSVKAMALGGQFTAGQKLLVGEQGPEVVSFGQAGSITSNPRTIGGYTAPGMSSDGGLTINFSGTLVGSNGMREFFQQARVYQDYETQRRSTS